MCSKKERLFFVSLTDKEIVEEKGKEECSNRRILKLIIRGLLIGLCIGLIFIIHNKLVNSSLDSNSVQKLNSILDDLLRVIPLVSAILYMILGCTQFCRGIVYENVDEKLKGRVHILIATTLLFIYVLLSRFVF